jgi:hypothetical protein
MSLTGSCLCGAVRFELSEPPDSASYCHCTRCQKRTGGAVSAQARIAPDAFRWIAGEEHVRVWDPPDQGWAKGFCALCGSHLFSRPQDEDLPRSLRMSAFDTDPGVRPAFRQFVAYAAPWEPIPEDGLPRFDESGGGHK